MSPGTYTLKWEVATTLTVVQWGGGGRLESPYVGVTKGILIFSSPKLDKVRGKLFP